MKQCKLCGDLKPITEFRRRRKSSESRVTECRSCHNAKNRQYEANNPGKKAANARRIYAQNPEGFHARSKRWEEANKERVMVSRRAADHVRYAVKTGKLTKPSACQHCGTTSVRIVSAHLDYARSLDVLWLCDRCHRRLDQGEARTRHYLLKLLHNGGEI
jgi:hypothetical protein